MVPSITSCSKSSQKQNKTNHERPSCLLEAVNRTNRVKGFAETNRIVLFNEFNWLTLLFPFEAESEKPTSPLKSKCQRNALYGCPFSERLNKAVRCSVFDQSEGKRQLKFSKMYSWRVDEESTSEWILAEEWILRIFI